MLHVSGLRRGGLDEQPLEEAVALERCRRDTLALLGEADVVAGHLDEAGRGEVRERLRHARLGASEALGDVDVAVRPAQAADHEDGLEVVF